MSGRRPLQLLACRRWAWPKWCRCVDVARDFVIPTPYKGKFCRLDGFAKSIADFSCAKRYWDVELNGV